MKSRCKQTCVEYSRSLPWIQNRSLLLIEHQWHPSQSPVYVNQPVQWAILGHSAHVSLVHTACPAPECRERRFVKGGDCLPTFFPVFVLCCGVDETVSLLSERRDDWTLWKESAVANLEGDGDGSECLFSIILHTPDIRLERSRTVVLLRRTAHVGDPISVSQLASVNLVAFLMITLAFTVRLLLVVLERGLFTLAAKCRHLNRPETTRSIAELEVIV